MDTEHCADFAVTHPSLEHVENVSPKLGFVRVTKIAFG